MDCSALNWLAIIVAAVASFAVGGLWYSPVLFGKTWQNLTGITDEKAKSANMLKTFGLSFVLSFFMAATLAMFIGPEATFVTGLCIGSTVGVFLAMASLGITYLFEQKPTALWLINGGYHAVSLAIMGGILGLWN
jgi:hypothetical protein